MAPLFSALVIVPGAALLLGLPFVVARFFQPASIAIRIAVVFVVGSVIGGVATLGGLALLGSFTLIEAWQVIAYLVSLGVGALLGGALLVVFCIKHSVLTLRSSVPPQAASAEL